MSTVSLARIIEEAQGLSIEERRQLMEFLSKEMHSPEQEHRDRLATSIRGKYANLLGSSDEFARRKGEEREVES